MVSQLSMTYKLKLLQFLILVLGAFTLVLAVVRLLALIMQVTVDGLHLLASYVAESGALLASMPALHFLYLLALACMVIVISCKLVKWAYKSVMEVKNYVR